MTTFSVRHPVFHLQLLQSFFNTLYSICNDYILLQSLSDTLFILSTMTTIPVRHPVFNQQWLQSLRVYSTLTTICVGHPVFNLQWLQSLWDTLYSIYNDYNLCETPCVERKCFCLLIFPMDGKVQSIEIKFSSQLIFMSKLANSFVNRVSYSYNKTNIVHSNA